MNGTRLACLTTVAVLLSSCEGQPNASGVYVAKSPREIVLIQVIEDKTGTITGRLETTTVSTGGVVISQEANIDGKASGHDLMFKPTSAWFGGVNASGNFTSTTMKLTREGDLLTVNRSSLAEYEEAVAELRTKGGAEAKQVADLRAQQQAVAVQQATAANTADGKAKLAAAESELKTALGRLNQSVNRSPDFGAKAREITAKMDRMLQPASSLSGVQRSQLVVAANQGIIATNQLEIQRGQEVIEAKTFAQRLDTIVGSIQQICATQNAVFGDECGEAKATIADVGNDLKRAVEMFKGQKEAIETSLPDRTLLLKGRAASRFARQPPKADISKVSS